MSCDSFGRAVDGLLKPSRRRFVQGLAAGGAIAGLGLWPKSSWAVQAQGLPNVLSGPEFDLTIGETPANFTGVTRPAITVNGSIPAPPLRWRAGTTVHQRLSIALPDRSTHRPSPSTP